MINRKLSNELLRVSELFQVVVLTGPRQSGKTTLCKNIFPDYKYIDLDDVSARTLVATNPKQFLIDNSTGLIIDEAQRYPDLFSYIKVVTDEYPNSKYIITGSSNFSLLEQITESLAGRAAILNLLPFSLDEIAESKNYSTDTLILKGGYPAIWSKQISHVDIIKNYYNTYIERDVRKISKIIHLSEFQAFIRICAGRVGAEYNASALSNEIGFSSNTINEWMNILEASFIAFRFRPFYKNIGKRLIKTPKLYFYDTALVCYLLGIENEQQLSTHPARGNIFENYVVLNFVKQRFNEGKDNNLYYYRDKSQREIDIVQEFSNEYHAYEIKSAQIFHTHFLDNLKYLKNILGENLTKTQVIFDGKMDINADINGVVSYRNTFIRNNKI